MDRRTTNELFTKIERTESYRKLVRGRKLLVVPSAIFLLVLLLLLAALTSFTSILDGQIVPGLTWALVYAYVVFLIPVLFSHLYSWRAKYFDRLGADAIREAEEKGDER